MKKERREIRTDEESLSRPTAEQTEYLRRQGNPYAKLSVLQPDDDESAIVNVVREPEPESTMSQKHFRSGCGRIFGQYIPKLESGKLRDYHRRFIERNETKSPRVRHKLFQRLKKYDLTDLPGLQAHFNRGEKEDLTEAKLRQIEDEADKEG
jgi:hypothetical protein